jgi:hypothetical protein
VGGASADDRYEHHGIVDRWVTACVFPRPPLRPSSYFSINPGLGCTPALVPGRCGRHRLLRWQLRCPTPKDRHLLRITSTIQRALVRPARSAGRIHGSGNYRSCTTWQWRLLHRHRPVGVRLALWRHHRLGPLLRRRRRAAAWMQTGDAGAGRRNAGCSHAPPGSYAPPRSYP